MAVSSDDWPRYSFLAGDARSHATPNSDESREQLQDTMSVAFTLEFWLQLRMPKQRTEGARSWIVSSPAWAIGVETSGEIIVRTQDTWLTTRLSRGEWASTPTLANRRWTHVASEIYTIFNKKTNR